MINAIKRAVAHFRTLSGNTRIVTHHDTDGITSASILAKALQREDRRFSISILKQMDKKAIDSILKEGDSAVFFLDLDSLMARYFENSKSSVFILDHHEIDKDMEIPDNVFVLNPHFLQEEEQEKNISSSIMAYLFAKELNELNTDLASLAIIGMISNLRDPKDTKTSSDILKEAEDITVKRSLLIFPATRPLHKALEFSSSIFIPGITGSAEGSLNLLKEAGIKLKEGDDYQRTLLDLAPEETSKLLKLLFLRKDESEVIGSIYLIKFFNHLEDARELSSLINSCGRMEQGSIAIEMCLGNKKARASAETIYSLYKHKLIAGLKWIFGNSRIDEEGYMIINAGSKIKDTLIGTLMSIMASSCVYPSGKILIGMAETEGGMLKVSARICGDEKEINLRRLIGPIAKAVGGEGGGHKRAAGCLIPKDKEHEFASLMKKDIESIMPKSLCSLNHQV